MDEGRNEWLMLATKQKGSLGTETLRETRFAWLFYAMMGFGF
jgi:hypothetical protein